MSEDVVNSRRFRWLLASFLALLLVQRASALDPAWATWQYLRDRWGADNGFVGGQVNAIAQTKDGYLWIGANGGLYRYDGLRFVALRPSNSDIPDLKKILGLATDDNGGLWIRMEGQSLWRYQDGKFHDVLLDNGIKDKDLTKEHVTAISRAFDGAILFSLASANFAGTYRYRNGKLEALISRSLLPNSVVVSVAQTTDGRVWLGTRDDGLFYVQNGQEVSATTGLTDEKINSLLPMENGSLLIATDRGVAQWDRRKIIQIYQPSPLQSAPVVALMKDHDDNVWIGTVHSLVRLNASGASPVNLDSENGGEPVTALFEGREGNVWVGCTSGFWRLKNGAFLTYSTKQGLPSSSNGPIYVDSMQRVWFAPMNGGVYWMKDGKVESLTIDGLNREIVYSIAGGKHNDIWIGRREGGLTNLSMRGDLVNEKTYKQVDGLAQNSVYAVFQSRDGTVWAGTLSGGLSAFREGKFVTYTKKDGLGANIIYSIEEGHDGTMWVGTAGGLSALSNGKWQNFTKEDGLPWDDVISLHEDSENVLWIGTTGGLAYMTSGEIHSVIDTETALREAVVGLTEDSSGSLWIATSDHIFRANRSDLLRGHLDQGSVREYGIDDGLLNAGGVRRDQSVVNDGNGRIWFSTNRGLSAVDWRKQTNDSPPTIVHIDAISSDGNPAAIGTVTRIPPLPRRVAIDYTGLNFTSPDRVQFQYQLKGFDRSWSQPVTTREAIYTNLPPGDYRFLVKASNNDGIWNGSETTLNFRIEPALWQAWWFQLLCLLGALCAALLFHRSRMGLIAKQLNARFEERLAERTRIAHQLHDTLLQGLLSASMQLHVAAGNVPENSVAKAQLDHILNLMSRVNEEGRNTLRGLRASIDDNSSLENALSSIHAELCIPKDTNYRVVVDGPARALHPVIREEIYCIGREALSNALRHAGASTIEVELQYTAANLLLAVRDNGCGIDSRVLESGRDGHWGLLGMRERAQDIGAELRLLSRSGAGTEVQLAVPAKVAYEPQSRDKWSHRFINVFRSQK